MGAAAGAESIAACEAARAAILVCLFLASLFLGHSFLQTFLRTGRPTRALLTVVSPFRRAVKRAARTRGLFVARTVRARWLDTGQNISACFRRARAFIRRRYRRESTGLARRSAMLVLPAVPSGAEWDALGADGADGVRHLGTVDLGDEGLEIFGAGRLGIARLATYCTRFLRPAVRPASTLTFARPPCTSGCCRVPSGRRRPLSHRPGASPSSNFWGKQPPSERLCATPEKSAGLPAA